MQDAAIMLRCRYGQTVAAGQEGDIMFVPQRPYMVLGSLREQVLYPTWATSGPHQQHEGSEHADRCVLCHLMQVTMCQLLIAASARHGALERKTTIQSLSCFTQLFVTNHVPQFALSEQHTFRVKTINLSSQEWLQQCKTNLFCRQ